MDDVRVETTWSGLDQDLLDLQKELGAATQMAMPSVGARMRDMLRLYVDDEVYADFKPRAYTRRGDKGGIIDMDAYTKILADANSVTLVYEPDGTDPQWEHPLSGDALIRRIESGLGYEWEGDHIPGPRSFFSDFVDELESTSGEKLAVSYMNAADPSLGITADDGEMLPDADDWTG